MKVLARLAAAGLLLSACASAQQVLVYGALPSGELPWYSGFGGLTVTTVDEPTWAAMTQLQFESYDMIWIGGINSIGSSGAPYVTLNATKATWSPAATGRVVISALHVGSIIHPTSGAMTFVDDTVAWLLAGGGTSLYCGQDVGLDAMNFMSQFGITGCSGVNCFNSNQVNVVMPAHPTMVNSTDSSLSNWGQSTHNQINTLPPEWTAVATGGGGGVPIVIVRDFSCNLLPPVTSPIIGDGDITFNAFEPGGNPVDTLFEFSLNGGLSWSMCTAALASPISNPDTIATPALGATFIWDTVADAVGTLGPVIAAVRLTVTSTVTMAMTSCELNYGVDNNQPIPTCTITMPVGGATVSGANFIEFVPISPFGIPLIVDIEWSSDGGMTFTRNTDAGGGTVTGNPTMTFMSGATETFEWQSEVDLPDNANNVIVRLTVTDTFFGLSSNCQVTVDVLNAPSCNLILPLPLAVVAGASVAINFTAASPLGNTVTASFNYSTDLGITFFPATDAGGGTLTGNPTAPFATGLLLRSWNWNTEANILGHEDPVVFRVVLTDTITGAMSLCEVAIVVDNMLCTMTTSFCGDCDADGRVTVLDAHELARITVGLDVEPAFGTDLFNACNVWGQGAPLPTASLGIEDALQVARYVVGLTGLQCCVP